MKIRTVGVAGCGLMGSGIAEVVARSGFAVRVLEETAEAAANGRERIERSLARAVEREKITAADRDAALAAISFVGEVDALAGCDLVVEAIIEEVAAKRALFRALDALLSPSALLATNTSSIPVTELAAAVRHPERVIGLHFFNPVPVMQLVEVVHTLATDPQAVAEAFAFVRALGKEAIGSADRSGFVVNLLLVPFMLDCVRQLERGVATVQEMDRAMVLGCGHPMGPLALCDFVGIDTTVRIAEIMFDEYREERYAPPPLLRRMVALGRVGRKSGRGFYDYSGPDPVALPVGAGR